MSEPEGEGFLARWARRKREAGQAGVLAGVPTDAPADASGDVARDAPAPAEPAPAPPTVDLSALPSLDSITAATDIRPFLAPGVPAELTRAALRRAWVADPQIRDFVGLAENQWDFTNPDAVPGFGTFGSADEIQKLVASVIGEKEHDAASVAPAVPPAPDTSPDAPPAGGSGPGEPGATTSEAARDDAQAAPLADVQRSETPRATAAAQKDDAARPTPNVPIRRGHGGALPS